MFKYLITIKPLGYLYGSAGGFLSPENLVGRSRAKFPPDPATLSGLFFSANYNDKEYKEHLVNNLYISGAFWAKENNIQDFYIPIPWTKIIEENEWDEWEISGGKWQRQTPDLKPSYQWQKISAWNQSAKSIQNSKSVEKSPWKFVSILHPKMKKDERHTTDENGLFLENAVQMEDDVCLVYLSTHELPDGWYRFGGENHLVEVTTIALNEDNQKRFQQPINKAFALISVAVWGSNRLSRRYPEAESFPKVDKLLTDRAIPYRYRAGGRMGRGRYGVSAGSVYVLSEPLHKSWWEWQDDWFPNEGYSLKKMGSGLCLPLEINGVN